VRLLVTCGAGYIGSVATRVLLEAGHEVVVLDDLSTGHRDAVPEGVELVELELHDVARLVRPGCGFGGVLHFAAKALVAESVTSPELYWRSNVGGSLRLLEAMRDASVPRLVFSSTCATYGQPDALPITEDLPTRPTNPYGASKLAVDHMVRSFCQAHGLGAVSLRYFNVAGAHGEAGERHAVETHLIPNALAVAAGHQDALQVFGTDYPTADGTCIRDYVHVRDLVDAHVRALAVTEPGAHEIVNLGTGTGFSVHQVVEAVRAVTGHPVPVRVAARRPGDPAALVAGNAKARDVLGWQPSRGDLLTMVADAWEFLRSRAVTA
jgi:UDP-glucose 4-epimerase